MAHTLIASKAVGRMMDAEDELGALKNSIEKDFMGSSALNWLGRRVFLTPYLLGSTVVRESTMSSAVGIMAIKIDKESPANRIRFLYGHTTDSMVLSLTPNGEEKALEI